MCLRAEGTQNESAPLSNSDLGTDYTFKRAIVWRNVLGFGILHLGGIYGLYLLPQAKIFTWIFLYLKLASATYVTCAGAHRLYSHRAFKAVYGHRLVLMFLHTMIGQNSMYIWVRDHRQHHKFSDTDADPHNSNRGFFFSHMGWLMSRKHPLVKGKSRTIDMRDLEDDPLVMFQYKYYSILYFIVAIPLLFLPVLFWNETLKNAFFVTYMFWYMYSLNATWTINSLAHLFGTKPYDKTIKPGENTFASMVTSGEGYHNYHHSFPWDYRAAELGQSFRFTTKMIDWTARMGWSYDLRTATGDVLLRKMQRTGELSNLLDKEVDDVWNRLSNVKGWDWEEDTTSL